MSEENPVKNTAKGSFQEEILEEGFRLLRFQSPLSERITTSYPLDKNFLQLHFVLKGQVQLAFNENNYQLQLLEEHSLLLYNTQKDLPINAELWPGTWMITVVMTLKKFHSLFSDQTEQIPYLSSISKEKKYYSQEAISPSKAIILNQLMHLGVHDSVRHLYVKGKLYELLALYFNRNEEANLEQCPYLADEENVRKIRMAKDIVINRMLEPPTLESLAVEIDLPLKKLKEGFREIYGDTVFGFLLNHKLELARKHLLRGELNVHDVGLRVGYSTSSHFIAAFKKKYGVTPKKYLQAQSVK